MRDGEREKEGDPLLCLCPPLVTMDKRTVKILRVVVTVVHARGPKLATV